jgi:hypothetical protein
MALTDVAGKIYSSLYFPHDSQATAKKTTHIFHVFQIVGEQRSLKPETSVDSLHQ